MLSRVLIASLVGTTMLLSSTISDYAVINQCIQTGEGKYFTAIRSLKKDAKPFYLAVDSSTLKTYLIPLSQSKPSQQCEPSAYEKLKNRALSNSVAIQNAGITEGKGQGYALTVDMCPSSKKGYERAFFQHLIKQQKNFPVTLSITGGWIAKHQKEFLELLQWSKEESLDITWMNHGFTHPYQREVAAEKNFINLPGVDFDAEIIDLEKLLLSYDQIPSIFYRFAGLVSTEKKIKKLVNIYGLIPLGSKAWIAKGEKVKEGSIVLLHGNKNESDGIKQYLTMSGNIRVNRINSILLTLKTIY